MKLSQKDIIDIDDIKRKHNGYFFSPETIRFWKSRVSETIYKNDNSVYFVTSEAGFNLPRAYTIRRFDLTTRSISTVDAFSRITRNRAHRNAKLLAETELLNNGGK